MIDATGASPPEYPPVCKYLDAPAAKLPDDVYNHLLNTANTTWRASQNGVDHAVTSAEDAMARAVILALMQHICYLESLIETTGN